MAVVAFVPVSMRVASVSSIAHVLSVSRAGALPCKASTSACSMSAASA